MLNKYQAELCGLFAGDGWINSKRNTVFICGSPHEKEFYDKHIKKLFEKGLKFTPKLRPFPYWGVYGAVAYSKQVRQFFESQGFNEGKKVLTVKVPSEIINSKELWPYFLRGIFDSDGSLCFEKNYSFGVVHKQRRRIRMVIGSASKDLIFALQEMCNQLGYHSRVRVQKPYAEGKHDFYRLQFDRKDEILRWMKEVNPKNNVHISRFKKWRKFGYY